MSKNSWQDLMGNADFSPVRQAADDESGPLNFDQLAIIASNKEAGEDDSQFYSGIFAPAKTSTFQAFLHEKTAGEYTFDYTKTADGEGTAPGYDLQIGDTAIASPPGATFEGTITAIEGDEITIERDVNGKTFTKKFNRSIVKPKTAVEEHQQKRKQEDEAEEAHKQQVVEEEMTKYHEHLKQMLTQGQATGTYDQLANYLMSAGYNLKCDPSDDQLEEFEQKYQDLTGEQLQATSRPKSEAHANKGGWILSFADTPEVRKFMPWPIDMSRTNLAPLRGGNFRATTDGKNIKVMYNEPIWELIARGLRYKPADEAQEVRVSSSLKVKKGSADYAVVKVALRHLYTLSSHKNVVASLAVLAKRGLDWNFDTRTAHGCGSKCEKCGEIHGGSHKCKKAEYENPGFAKSYCAKCRRETKHAVRDNEKQCTVCHTLGTKVGEYQPKTGQPCSCRPGRERDNCPQCEGTGQRVDFKAIREKTSEDPTGNFPAFVRNKGDQPGGILPKSKGRGEMEQEHPGAVCSECGRTVTNGEYSIGQSSCCKADVCAEEEFGEALMGGFDGN